MNARRKPPFRWTKRRTAIRYFIEKLGVADASDEIKRIVTDGLRKQGARESELIMALVGWDKDIEEVIGVMERQGCEVKP